MGINGCPRSDISYPVCVLLTLAKTGISAKKEKKKKRKFTMMIPLRFSIAKFVSSSRQVGIRGSNER